MKKTATITLNDKVITINELTMRQILDFKDRFSTLDMMAGMQELVTMLTDATPDFLLNLTPSELRTIFEKVKEVNADFFALFPLDVLLAGYRDMVIETVRQNLSALSAGSLLPDMAPAHGATV